MMFAFHFGEMWAARDLFIRGATLTIGLSAVSMIASLLVAVFGALARTAGPRWLRMLVGAYVEFIRNTPFLVQLYMIYFALPLFGLRMNAEWSALFAMVLNGSAYTIEIVRAGVESVGRGQIEAATALGLRQFPVFRLIVLPQALAAMFAPLGSQFILLMLTSSVISAISAFDLTAAALDIQSRTFLPFEAYLTAMAIYFLISLLFSGLFSSIDRWAFRRPGRA
jgi:polar amino acid transport system permease protein